MSSFFFWFMKPIGELAAGIVIFIGLFVVIMGIQYFAYFIDYIKNLFKWRKK